MVPVAGKEEVVAVEVAANAAMVADAGVLQVMGGKWVTVAGFCALVRLVQERPTRSRTTNRVATARASEQAGPVGNGPVERIEHALPYARVVAVVRAVDAAALLGVQVQRVQRAQHVRHGDELRLGEAERRARRAHDRAARVGRRLPPTVQGRARARARGGVVGDIAPEAGAAWRVEVLRAWLAQQPELVRRQRLQPRDHMADGLVVGSEAQVVALAIAARNRSAVAAALGRARPARLALSPALSLALRSQPPPGAVAPATSAAPAAPAAPTSAPATFVVLSLALCAFCKRPLCRRHPPCLGLGPLHCSLARLSPRTVAGGVAIVVVPGGNGEGEGAGGEGGGKEGMVWFWG
eukprot:scaffold4229_cov67-Phaeocystis_antarctica.AAC.7